MKITFISPPSDMSGGQRVITMYASRLRERGHEVVVVAPPHRPRTLREACRSFRRGNGFDWGVPRIPRHLDAHPGLSKVLDRHRPVCAGDVPDADIVIATWWETAEWVAAFPAEKGSKVYFIQGYEIFPYIPIERVEATLRNDFRKITISQWLVDILRERYGDPNAELISNGVDIRQFQAPPRSKNATPAVGFVYCAERNKGADIALKAVALAAERVPGLRLICFGSRPPVADIVESSGMEFTQLPAQDRISEIYSQCDAWLFPSRSEGFGLPILEAMACRTPVIAAPAGAAPELIRQGGGVLVPTEDSEAMAEAIVRIVGLDADAWEKLSDEALKTAHRNSWEESVLKFEAVLEEAAKRENARGPWRNAQKTPEVAGA